MSQGRLWLVLACLMTGLSIQGHAANVGNLKLKPGAVIYGVVPSLFGSNPYKDVTAKLDYLEDQGVDVLWLAPVNATDDLGAISYSITDFLNLRSDMGSEDDLRELVRQAHLRDIRVLLDFVPNHTSLEHPYFQHALDLGQTSPYYDYYDRDANGEHTFYFDWEHLPNLNYKHDGVISMMTKAFRFWLRKLGVDGYRVDVAWGVRQRAPQFWSELNRRLRRDRKDMIMLAEASARDTYYVENGFDLAYDWTAELGIWAWREAFENPETTGQQLSEMLAANPRPETVARFLNNNDTGERFISRYGVATTRVAAVLQHSVPGVPIVYSGDEVGALYEPYDDPPPLEWQDTHGLRPLYQRLARLREDEVSLHSGEFKLFRLPNQPQLVVYERYHAQSKQMILAVLNFGDATRVQIPRASLKLKCSSCSFIDLLSGRKVEGGQKTLTFQLGAHQAMLLKSQ